MQWIDVSAFPDPPGTEFIPSEPWQENLRWSFCDRHGIWHYTDTCPACQTQWPESLPGIPCQECSHCIHSTGWRGRNPCPHTCEPVICHDGSACERTPS